MVPAVIPPFSKKPKEQAPHLKLDFSYHLRQVERDILEVNAKAPQHVNAVMARHGESVLGRCRGLLCQGMAPHNVPKKPSGGSAMEGKA